MTSAPFLNGCETGGIGFPGQTLLTRVTGEYIKSQPFNTLENIQARRETRRASCCLLPVRCALLGEEHLLHGDPVAGLEAIQVEPVGH